MSWYQLYTKPLFELILTHWILPEILNAKVFKDIDFFLIRYQITLNVKDIVGPGDLGVNIEIHFEQLYLYSMVLTDMFSNKLICFEIWFDSSADSERALQLQTKRRDTYQY